MLSQAFLEKARSGRLKVDTTIVFWKSDQENIKTAVHYNLELLKAVFRLENCKVKRPRIKANDGKHLIVVDEQYGFGLHLALMLAARFIFYEGKVESMGPDAIEFERHTASLLNGRIVLSTIALARRYSIRGVIEELKRLICNEDYISRCTDIWNGMMLQRYCSPTWLRGHGLDYWRKEIVRRLQQHFPSFKHAISQTKEWNADVRLFDKRRAKTWPGQYVMLPGYTFGQALQHGGVYPLPGTLAYYDAISRESESTICDELEMGFFRKLEEEGPTSRMGRLLHGQQQDRMGLLRNG